MKPMRGRLAAAQQGVVLLLLTMILFMAGAGWLLTALTNSQVSGQRDATTAVALNTARDQLIAYAVMHGDYYPATQVGPGHLPCPDTNGDGVEDTPCAANAPGRLPQSFILPTAAVMPLSDYNSGIDQQFWYVVSPAFKRAPFGIANTTSVGGVTLGGQAGIAALLFAPGEVVGTQARVNNISTNYLEAGNTAGPNYVSSDALAPANFNDRVLAVTVRDLMSPVTARVVEAMRTQIIAFQVLNGFYPGNVADFNTAMATAPTWLLNNQWQQPAVTTYTVLSPTTATIQFTSCNIIYTLDYAANTITKNGARC